MNSPQADPQRTYRTALLQVVAYKKLQNLVSPVLKEYELNSTQWIILGELFDNPRGLRMTDLARALHVEVPLITIVTQPLIKRGLVLARVLREDKRAKLVTLSEEAQQLVRQIESRLRAHLSRALKAVPTDELRTYFKVLQTICQEVPPT